MKTLLGNVLGAWLAFATIALFVRRFGPKDTTITCGWCGHAVPMDVAQRGGVGAVNLEMRTHMEQCESHPMRLAKLELADARAALKMIHQTANEPTATHGMPGQRLWDIREIAGRFQ